MNHIKFPFPVVKYCNFFCFVQSSLNILASQVFIDFAWSCLLINISSFSFINFLIRKKNPIIIFFKFLGLITDIEYFLANESGAVFLPLSSILNYILICSFLPKNSWYNCMMNPHNNSKISVFYVYYL